jgi:HEPN domain-containing protein
MKELSFMNNREIANEWFSFADNDLNSAKFLMKMIPTPLEIICYHCQQSAEKYLKGYIALNGGSILKTHDLTFLNKACLQFDPTFKDILDDCIELVDYGVQVRYPFHIDLKKEDMILALESADRVQAFVLSKV